MSHSYARVVTSALEHPWALTKPMCLIVAEVLARRIAGQQLSDEVIQTRIAMAVEGKELHAAKPQLLEETVADTDAGMTAVLLVAGLITPRGDAFDEASGMTSAERIGNELLALQGDDRVTRIVLDVDSPGGNVAGITELAAVVRSVSATKRLVAVANHEMGSAAYWIASGATEIVASPSSMVGSIGVFSIHKDISAMLEKLGVNVTLISAGKFKAEGAEHEPLTDIAEEHIQATVDRMFTAFTGDVATGRGVTRSEVVDGFGQGLVVSAQEGLEAGMVDKVATMRDVLAEAPPRRQGGTLTASASRPDDVDLRTRRTRLARARAV